MLCLEVCILLIVHPQSLKRQQSMAVGPTNPLMGLGRRKKKGEMGLHPT